MSKYRLATDILFCAQCRKKKPSPRDFTAHCHIKPTPKEPVCDQCRRKDESIFNKMLRSNIVDDVHNPSNYSGSKKVADNPEKSKTRRAIDDILENAKICREHDYMEE